MSCPICSHPKRQEIDQALIAGSATVNDLCKEHGLSAAALNRHQGHLHAKVSRAKAGLEKNLFQRCYFWLSQALEISMQTAQTAQADGNSKLVLQALAQGTRLIKMIQKHDFQLEDAMVYDILTSPQWVSQNTLLPHDPGIIARSRRSLAGIFTAPCPDGPPPPSPGEQRVDGAIRAVPLIPAKPQPGAENGKPQPANLLPKWQKGGDSSDDCYMFDEEEQYRLLELERRTGHLDFEALTLGLSPAAANAKIDALMEKIWQEIPLPTDKPLSEYLHEQS